MAELDLENCNWVYDTIPHYRLNENIIDGFLSSIWNGYEFFIEVRHQDWHAAQRPLTHPAPRQRVSILRATQSYQMFPRNFKKMVKPPIPSLLRAVSHGPCRKPLRGSAEFSHKPYAQQQVDVPS
ncbi:MAG: hypothetical protein Q9167_003583 [Letrouitia subvulpina]